MGADPIVSSHFSAPFFFSGSWRIPLSRHTSPPPSFAEFSSSVLKMFSHPFVSGPDTSDASPDVVDTDIFLTAIFIIFYSLCFLSPQRGAGIQKQIRQDRGMLVAVDCAARCSQGERKDPRIAQALRRPFKSAQDDLAPFPTLWLMASHSSTARVVSLVLLAPAVGNFWATWQRLLAMRKTRLRNIEFYSCFSDELVFSFTRRF